MNFFWNSAKGCFRKCLNESDNFQEFLWWFLQNFYKDSFKNSSKNFLHKFFLWLFGKCSRNFFKNVYTFYFELEIISTDSFENVHWYVPRNSFRDSSRKPSRDPSKQLSVIRASFPPEISTGVCTAFPSVLLPEMSFC